MVIPLTDRPIGPSIGHSNIQCMAHSFYCSFNWSFYWSLHRSLLDRSFSRAVHISSTTYDHYYSKYIKFRPRSLAPRWTRNNNTSLPNSVRPSGSVLGPLGIPLEQSSLDELNTNRSNKRMVIARRGLLLLREMFVMAAATPCSALSGRRRRKRQKLDLSSTHGGALSSCR